MAVDGGAGDVEQVGDLLDGLAGVLELLAKFCLAGGEFGPAAAGATASPGQRRGRRGCWPRSARVRSSARTESMPNMARPSVVEVSMPLIDDVQAYAALMQVGAEVRVV